MVQGLIDTARHVQSQYKKISLAEDVNAGTIKLIDFGQARKYKDDNGNHLAQTRSRTFTFLGCPLFMSTRHFEGRQMSRQDDLLSLMFSIIYMVDDELDWDGLSKQ